ncbi:hypothetical protein I6F35_36130 [Bradyrhizobium sp. BRP22]|uniref:hypothetical protein n=1 Tax=Bradyrhizobium sp. BRP22 TaxID=2793821 RepID=UPI001CD425E8|nr:hypothetical protein [Bradyrhizobium sp. BRP22]MCA1458534.1 hypothetical protein [Bradyrhizobium sp. BRP22]
MHDSHASYRNENKIISFALFLRRTFLAVRQLDPDAPSLRLVLVSSGRTVATALMRIPQFHALRVPFHRRLRNQRQRSVAWIAFPYRDVMKIRCNACVLCPQRRSHLYRAEFILNFSMMGEQ